MQNLSPYGGVSVLVVGDFLQLPPLTKKFRSSSGCLWEKLQLHGLVEIVQQSSDPDFLCYLIEFEKVSKHIMMSFK